MGVERAAAHCAGWEWDAKDGEPSEEIMGPKWRELEGLPAPGTLKNIVIIRPAFFTDGEAKGDKIRPRGQKPYKVSEEDIGGYVVSRKDVAHFLVEDILVHWDKYQGRRMRISY